MLPCGVCNNRYSVSQISKFLLDSGYVCLTCLLNQHQNLSKDFKIINQVCVMGEEDVEEK